jgi:non-canonical poly(A) RNA polymerase PAPD5/7
LVIKRITAVVIKLWGDAQIKLYGSYATGLWLPSSDLDVVILPGDEAPVSGVRSALHWLACVLGKKAWTQSVRVIHNTKVPVIKLVAIVNDTQICVDITYCVEEGKATPHTGLLSNHLVRQYISTLPELRPLALVIKQFLIEKGLSQTYTGGLSSYCLVLMLVSYLQEQPDAHVKSGSQPPTQPPPFTVRSESAANLNVLSESGAIKVAKSAAKSRHPEIGVRSHPLLPLALHLCASKQERGNIHHST